MYFAEKVCIFTHLKVCICKIKVCKKTRLKACVFSRFPLVAKFTHLKACFSKRCVFLHTIWCVFCPESLANKVHTLSRAFLHTLQGVQNNTPFCLLHSLQIHTLEGVQNYTPLFSLVSNHRSNWNKKYIKEATYLSVQFTNLIIAKIIKYLQYIS